MRKLLLTVALMLTVPSLATAQTESGELGDPVEDDPSPVPHVGGVTEDGLVRVSSDVFIGCNSYAQTTVSDEEVRAETAAGRNALGEDAPSEREVRVESEEQVAEYARACREAGFLPPEDAAAASTEDAMLPDTGGVVLPQTPGLGVLLAAGSLLVWVFAWCFQIALRLTYQSPAHEVGGEQGEERSHPVS